MVYREPIPFRNDKDVLYVHFLNIGEGDCTLIEMPSENGHENILVDLGTGGSDLLKDLLGIIGVETIHHALITHPHEDHCTDIDILLEKYPNLLIWLPKCYPKNAPQFYRDLFKRYFNRFIFPEIGVLKQSGGARFNLIGPSLDYFNFLKDSTKSEENIELNTRMGIKKLTNFISGMLDFTQTNNSSLVCSVAYCGITILLPGDLDGEGWNALFHDESSKLKIDILKVAHHGSAKNTPKQLIGTIFPKYGVVTYVDGVKRGTAVGRIRNDIGVEECFYLGFLEGKFTNYKNRISCSFAIKPNRTKTRGVIIPMIYISKEDGTVSLHIRPLDKDVKKYKSSPSQSKEHAIESE